MRPVCHAAGVDLQGFVENWLSEALDDPDPRLLREAEARPDDGATLGAAFLMRTLAPLLWEEEGTREQLILFGTLAVYQHGRNSRRWNGCVQYVEAAFDHLHEIGEAEAARQLVTEANMDAVDDDAIRSRNETTSRWRDSDPARLARYDQTMAAASNRELRAARALDPTVNISPI